MIGGVAGAVGGFAYGFLSAAGTTYLGTGVLATIGTTIGAGAAGAALGDVAGQLVGIGIGAQNEYRWQQTAGAAAGGAVFGPLARYSGGSIYSMIGAGAASGLVADTSTQSLELLTGVRSEWDYMRTATSTTLGGVGGLGGYYAQRYASANYNSTARLSRLTGSLTKGQVARSLLVGDEKTYWERGWMRVQGKTTAQIHEEVANSWARIRGEMIFDVKRGNKNGYDQLAHRTRTMVGETTSHNGSPATRKWSALGSNNENINTINYRHAFKVLSEDPTLSTSVRDTIQTNLEGPAGIRVYGGSRTYVSPETRAWLVDISGYNGGVQFIQLFPGFTPYHQHPAKR